ncbi:MAG: hypothetical protein HQL50_09020, partial [Magnetococcales bacterium]|nr:hypothetical protein [Magnetococcales bacterium]
MNTSFQNRALFSLTLVLLLFLVGAEQARGFDQFGKVNPFFAGECFRDWEEGDLHYFQNTCDREITVAYCSHTKKFSGKHCGQNKAPNNVYFTHMKHLGPYEKDYKYKGGLMEFAPCFGRINQWERPLRFKSHKRGWFYCPPPKKKKTKKEKKSHEKEARAARPEPPKPSKDSERRGRESKQSTPYFQGDDEQSEPSENSDRREWESKQSTPETRGNVTTGRAAYQCLEVWRDGDRLYYKNTCNRPITAVYCSRTRKHSGKLCGDNPSKDNPFYTHMTPLKPGESNWRYKPGELQFAVCDGLIHAWTQ